MSTREELLKLLKLGRWLTIPVIQSYLNRQGIYLMETTVSTRLRDFRKPEFGGHDLPARRKKGSKLWEYKLTN